MPRKPKKDLKKIDPNLVKTRDLLMVAVINGVTKAGVHKNLRKETRKYQARQKVRLDEEQ